MRAELAELGIEETKTSEEVKSAVETTDGTVMVIVNSVCGCAAGGVRPGIAMALANSEAKPDKRSRFLPELISTRPTRLVTSLQAISRRRQRSAF